MSLPVKIKKILCAGGACPYQIEAETEDGQYFYLRYRGGRLRAGVAPTSEQFTHSKESYNVIDIEHGHTLAGWAHDDELRPLLEGKVIFPEGFKMEYEHVDNYTHEDPRDGLPDPQ